MAAAQIILRKLSRRRRVATVRFRQENLQVEAARLVAAGLRGDAKGTLRGAM